MSDENEFEKTVSDVDHSHCAFCEGRIVGDYFDINGQTSCERCMTESTYDPPGRYTTGRVVKALGLGICGAIIGSLLYFFIMKVTGYEVGLVSIAVGIVVGKAIFIGSGRLGGLGYQLLAVGLTYLAIVSTYVPLVLEAIMEDEAAYAIEETIDESTTPSEASEDTTDESPAGENSEQNDLSGVELAMALAAMAGTLLALPFLAGFENIMGLIIIAIGLYEAWKYSAKLPIEISGPYQVN